MVRPNILPTRLTAKPNFYRLQRSHCKQVRSILHFLPFTFSSRHTTKGAEGYEHQSLTQTTPSAPGTAKPTDSELLGTSILINRRPANVARNAECGWHLASVKVLKFGSPKLCQRANSVRICTDFLVVCVRLYLTRTSTGPTHIRNVKFQGNRYSGMRSDACMQTDGWTD